MAKSSKIVSLSQEVIRRQKNTGRNVRTERRIEIINEFAKKLELSGYGEKDRLEIITSGTKKYYRKVANELKGGEMVNPDNSRNRSAGKIEGMIKKQKWHQTSNKDNMVEGLELKIITGSVRHWEEGGHQPTR